MKYVFAALLIYFVAPLANAQTLNSMCSDDIVNGDTSEARRDALISCLEQLSRQVEALGSVTQQSISEMENLSIAAPWNNAIPPGSIIAWHGSGKVPDGWAICNGDNGTPDLRGMFIRGVGTVSEVGVDPNGTDTHTHSASVAKTSSKHADGGLLQGTHQGPDDATFTTNLHVHPVAVQRAPNIPPNYKLLYLMKL